MATDDVKAAAREFLASVAGRHNPALGYSDLPTALAAAARVSEYVLAEHPADDDEPVTREFVGSKDNGDGSHDVARSGELIVVWYRAGVIAPVPVLALYTSRVGVMWEHPSPTRGDVRRLLAALNIPAPAEG